MEEVKPVLFVSGHIHSGRGAILTPNTNYVNASVLNNRYEKEAEAYLFELDVDNYSLKYISG
jgi:Icc-related predicted phosphoesterase